MVAGMRPRAAARKLEPESTLQNIYKRYGSVTALAGVSLTLRPGEIVALLGPNGAGKTTAVGLLLGLVRPDGGRVHLFGGSPRDAAVRARVGAMLQLSGVPETLTVAEHLRVFAAYYPRPSAFVSVIERTGLTGLERRPYGKLSGGQKQRLHLALALVGDPDLLVLDEPTVGLDVSSRRALWDVVRDAAAEGKTVLLTTHLLEEADALADRVVILQNGRVRAEGTPAAVKAQVAGRRVRCVTRLDAESICSLPGVTSVTKDGAVTAILTNRAEPVVAELLRRDPALSALEVSGAGLEEAFLALTETAVRA